MVLFNKRKPKVSCVTVTTGRLEQLYQAVRCYVQQTYTEKELVIVSQGNKVINEQIRSFVNQCSRKDILFVEAPENLSLGAMRNLSVELTTGEIICQWDDDDLYHPYRIQTQVSKMDIESADVVLFTSFLKYFKNTREMYYCDWSKDDDRTHRFLCGSVMFKKFIFHHCQNYLYPEHGPQSVVEEDLSALERMTLHGKVVGLENEGHCYVYVYHGNNTYDLAHHQLPLTSKDRKILLSSNELIAKRKLIEQTLDVSGIDDIIHVKSLNELAFIYEPSRTSNESSKT